MAKDKAILEAVIKGEREEKGTIVIIWKYCKIPGLDLTIKIQDGVINSHICSCHFEAI